MAYETLIVEIEEHVALIRLNRPDAMNALNSAMMGELCDALRMIETNDKARCTVITGSEKAFAAGADVGELAEKSFHEMYMSDHFGPITRTFRDCRKP